MLLEVEFAYNATRALGIEHTTFEANYGFSQEEPLEMRFTMQPLIPVSQDASKRLKFSKKVNVLVRTVLQLQKEKMQSCSEPSTSPHFVRVNKVSAVTMNLFMRGQPNRKVHDLQHGPFTMMSILGNIITNYGYQRMFAYTRYFTSKI
jgi:hypothetical protein